MKKEIIINPIKNGTVIDHLPSDKTFDVVKILGLKGLNRNISLGTGLKSSKMGTKGIIKISDKFLSQKELNKIAIVAPEASVSIIKNSKVSKKVKIDVPDITEDILRCFNPNCITNKEKVSTKFYTQLKDPLIVKCHYCERLMKKEDIELL